MQFCGFCLSKHLRKWAKREILLLSLRATPFGGTCIQQSQTISLCIATRKIVMKLSNNSNAILKFKLHTLFIAISPKGKSKSLVPLKNGGVACIK